MERRRWAFLGLIALLFLRPARPQGAPRLRRTRTNGCSGARGDRACASFTAIVWELARSRRWTGLVKAGHLTLVAATILSAWTFIQVMFALHYAGVYSSAGRRGDPGGLDFPGTPSRGWGEFVYQAFVIGCTSATSDVNVTSTRMRRICRRPGRGRVLLQHHHSRADDQHRGELDLNRSALFGTGPDDRRRSNRVRAALPRGLVDRDAADIAATEAMMATIRDVYELYGFEAVETPFIEYTEALGKFLPDQDRPNEGVFSFQDDDEQWLSLRYDLTAPLARYVAENYERLPKPYRSYRAGWVFRNEKPGPGRFRQFMQFDADTVGAASRRRRRRDVHDDGRHAGGARHPARRTTSIKVNNRKVLDGVMEAIGLGGETTPAGG